MKKKIVGFLLVLCLVISLLPVAALADVTTAKVCILGEFELSVTEGGEPTYLKNKEFDAYNKADGSSTFKGWTQEKATKDDWNVKFEWPKGGTPTVTLKDAKMDFFDNETKAYAYIKQADGKYISTANRTTGDLEQCGETENNLLISAIQPVDNCAIDLKVVLEGNNTVETGSGFVFGDMNVKANMKEQSAKTYKNTYFKNLTFTSVGEGKLVANGGGIGIMAKTGYNIAFENAYIEIKNTTHGTNACPVHATNANITVNGGHLKLSNTLNPAMYIAGTSGDITINGDMTLSHSLTSTAGSSSMFPKGGTLTINGGNITGVSTNAPILNGGKGVIVNGGNLKLTSAYYGVMADAGGIQINGGTMEIIAERAFRHPPKLGEKMNAYAGANKDNCEVYDGSVASLSMKPWMFLSDTETIEIPEPEDEETPMFTGVAPTTPAATTAPTSSTTPTTAPTQGADDAQGGNDTLVWIIVAAVVVLAGAAIAVIVIKRKKA